MRKAPAIAVVVAAMIGCGSDSGSGGGSNGDESMRPHDCLSVREVDRKIDEIAGGYETSQEEVEAKGQAIREIQAQQC